MRFPAKLALLVVLVAAVLAPSAAGSPSADLSAVAGDYASGKRITPCRFTQAQLARARTLINGDVATYAAGLGPAIDREIKRRKDRGCTAKRRAAGAGANIAIATIHSQGGASAESVTIRNRSRKSVNLRGYSLRDAGDHTLKFRSTKLAPGRTLRVITGCRTGTRKAVRRGSRYYVCRSKEVWDDTGDVVELLGPGGGLLSTKTYGTPPSPTP